MATSKIVNGIASQAAEAKKRMTKEDDEGYTHEVYQYYAQNSRKFAKIYVKIICNLLSASHKGLRISQVLNLVLACWVVVCV